MVISTYFINIAEMINLKSEKVNGKKGSGNFRYFVCFFPNLQYFFFYKILMFQFDKSSQFRQLLGKFGIHLKIGNLCLI